MVQLLSGVITAYLLLQETAKLFHKVTVPSRFPPAMHRLSSLSERVFAFGAVSIYFSILLGVSRHHRFLVRDELIYGVLEKTFQW